MPEPRTCSVAGCNNVVPINRVDECGQHEVAAQFLDRHLSGSRAGRMQNRVLAQASPSAAVASQPEPLKLPPVPGATKPLLKPTPPAARAPSAAVSSAHDLQTQAEDYQWNHRQQRATYSLRKQPSHNESLKKMHAAFARLWQISEFETALKKECVVVSGSALLACLEPPAFAKSRLGQSAYNFQMLGLDYSTHNRQFATEYMFALEWCCNNQSKEADASMFTQVCAMVGGPLVAPFVAGLSGVTNIAYKAGNKLTKFGVTKALSAISKNAADDSEIGIEVQANWGLINKVFRPQNILKFTACWIEFIRTKDCPEDLSKEIIWEFGQDRLDHILKILRGIR